MTKDKNTDLVATESSEAQGLIAQAIAANAPVETMERLFALRKEIKAEVAKEQFTVALGKFQTACPVIKKTKKVMNKDGQSVRYQYAPLDGIVSQIKTALNESRLSYSWDVKHIEGHMVVTCKITHVLGHFETSELQIPIDKEGFMTAPQKYASAQTFAKRYTLINALGISTADEDTDASDVKKEPTAKNPKSKIVFLLKALKEKHTSKEDVEKAVMKLTKLKLEDANLGEIVARLEAIVSEHENN